MLKFTVAVLAVALAGTASAGGWRDLRIDGSSEAGFVESVAVLNKKLTLERRYVFVQALQDIWRQGVATAKAANREYTASEYFRDTNGLGYYEVVNLLDPTGETAKARYWEASRLRAIPGSGLYTFPENQNWPAGDASWPGDSALSTPQSVEHALQPAPQG